VLVVLSEEQADVALSFRNLARVGVLPAEGVGVADLVGAASLLLTEDALAELTQRANGEKAAAAEEAAPAKAAPAKAAPKAAAAEPEPEDEADEPEDGADEPEEADE
jgi:hypothetical protein